jgi:hypothetical protein
MPDKQWQRSLSAAGKDRVALDNQMQQIWKKFRTCAVALWFSTRDCSLVISRLVKRLRNRKITAQLNSVYSRESSALDPVLQRLQAETYRNTDWEWN